uniref:Prostaglandin D2 receptor 2-like n=1 Tax=Lepisosteus oculatus TaxID=7918 RepID=W5N6Q6_LEPOC
RDMINTSKHSNSSDRPFSYAAVCLHGIVSIFGILENLLILWVIGFRVRRTVISVWIINLAASDLLATISLPFFTHFLARGGTWTLGTTFCKIHSSMFFLNMFVSGFLLSVISLDRCLVVIYPVWSQNHRDVRLATQVCIGIWILAVINTIPYYVFRDTIERNDGRIMCYYNYAQYRSPEQEVDTLCGMSKFLLSFFIPLLVIIGSYMAVSSSITRRGRKRTYRFFRLVVAVIITFILCWIPYHIFSLLEAATHYYPSLHHSVSLALPLVSSLAFINSVVNPFLYVFSCPDFLAKIRQSLSAVMESVLMEDTDFQHRRSTTRSSVSTSELL